MKRILFANIGWMNYYQGFNSGDTISGGGSYRDDDKHEAYNFQNLNGMCYGYVQPVRWGSIKLSRIDPIVGNDKEKIEDVLVIWTARRPGEGGTVIVGWYKHATVYSDFQEIKAPERNNYGFNISARSKDCTLLSIDDRCFSILRAQNGIDGGMGQSNVWYADKGSSRILKFRQSVIDYLSLTEKPSNYSQKKIKVNVEARKQVEEKAVNYVVEVYKKRGFFVKSVEKENLGWDLEAQNGKIKLRIEVKGLAGDEMYVHITQNEYSKMQAQDNANYRLCIVTNVLFNPELYVFLNDNNKWVCEDDMKIELCFNEQIAAVGYLKA